MAAALTPESPLTSNAPPMAEGLSFASTPDFDILDWHPAYQSCQRYFLDHAQHEPASQALCALINIRLPFQWRVNPVQSSRISTTSSSPSQTGTKEWPATSTALPGGARSPNPGRQAFVSLVPYIRRLIVTGFDNDGILHGFFGDAYKEGIGPMRDCERRNYLFAAKHGGWGACKKQYEDGDEETVPFMQPLRGVQADELEAADRSWSAWLAFEDWMIGPRAPSEEYSRRDERQRYDEAMVDGDRTQP